MMKTMNKGIRGFVAAMVTGMMVLALAPAAVFADSYTHVIPFTASTAPLPAAYYVRFCVNMNAQDPGAELFECYIVFPQTADGTMDSLQYSMDGAAAYLDPAGRVMVPMRYLADALNASIKWNGATQEVTITKGATTIEMNVGSTTLTTNGVPSQMDVAPTLIDGRVYLPVRYVATALGGDIAPFREGPDTYTTIGIVDIGMNLPAYQTDF